MVGLPANEEITLFLHSVISDRDPIDAVMIIEQRRQSFVADCMARKAK